MRAAKTDIDPAGFQEFLKGVQLKSIETESCSATIRDARARKLKAPGIAIAYDVRKAEQSKGRFELLVFYGVRILEKEGGDVEQSWLAQLEVEFRVTYLSKAELDDECLLPFALSTVRLNTSPFAREWVHSTSVKMGMAPVTLPLMLSFNPPDPASRKPVRRRRSKQA